MGVLLAVRRFGSDGELAGLRAAGISPTITRIVVNNVTKTVYVQMTADVSPLFPEFLQVSPISAWGEAQVRVSGR